ncbi:hypothetical protein YTPLAS18_02250 [Nitrospira sp.]|nr:hypothetical protein YTPLAS18_02250 [Nitrospira sp.]
MFLSRRQFLKVTAGTVAAAAIADKALALTALQPVIEVGNPLGDYPDRSWERVYHDQYRYDSSFTWCCSPNDTHGCRIRAFVRNGVVMRVEQNSTITRPTKTSTATAGRSRTTRACA